MPKLSTLSRSIEDRVALITGAANGMGRATAHLFADEGAQVAVVDVDADGVERVAKEITGAGGAAHGLQSGPRARHAQERAVRRPDPEELGGDRASPRRRRRRR